ncbi:hypothetical protein ACJJIK_11510 [Microbulbifer sp. ZKSA006]|uniref:hypothetical protein n=1 Tax=Microbulbifer sp. ZKSA006 TaxID=3243390 RepID=UPI0040398CE2
MPKITMEEIGDTSAKPYSPSWDEQAKLFSLPSKDPAETCEFKVNTDLGDEKACQLKREWGHEVVGYGVSILIIPGGMAKNAEDQPVTLNR